MNNNFRNDIEIDNENLEDELTRHAATYYDYDEKFNEAKEILAKLELDLSIAEADAAYAIRNGTYNRNLPGGKITEGVVKELIESDRDLIAKRSTVIEQKRAVAKYGSAIEALRHRRYTLQKLVDLWIYNYYNTIKTGKLTPDRDDQLMGLTNMEENVDE